MKDPNPVETKEPAPNGFMFAGGGKLVSFAPNAERIKGRGDSAVWVCWRALGVVFCDEPDKLQRGACKRMLDGLSSGEAERDRLGSPWLLSLSVRIWSMTDCASAP